MPTLVLRFPGGRYHATPWGHHVNEGLVEWPPSPWRLLRALLACGYATEGWKKIPPPARRLAEALASTLPVYVLPRAVIGHSRHFMPTGVLDKGREKTTLVFDAWADVGDGRLVIRWDCVLDQEALALFGRLCANLGYVGRSESWVVGEAAPDGDAPVDRFDACPHVEGLRMGPGWEQVSLMAADSAAEYDAWRIANVARTPDALPLLGGHKKPSASVLTARTTAEAKYPADLLDCLQRDTAWWKGHRWNQPPGSRRVLYWRRSNGLEAPPIARPFRPAPTPVAAILLSLTTPSGRLASLPSTTRALPQAELLHRAFVARLGAGGMPACPELTGRDVNGKPLTGHRHAHILPLDLDRDGRLDHILIFASMGLGAAAQRAIRGVDRTWTKGGVGELRLAVVGSGELHDLRGLPAPFGAGVAALLGPIGGCRLWRTQSPLVLPRHLKRRGANTVAGQVGAELVSRGLPPAALRVLPLDHRPLRLRHAVRVRRHPASPPPVDFGLAVELEFEMPVEGPIALGYGSHFGLGVFAAEV